MQVTPSQWGNSLGIRLPKEIVRQAGFKKGEAVEMIARDGKAIISAPKKRRRYTIDQLMQGMTPALTREAAAEIDWGLILSR